VHEGRRGKWRGGCGHFLPSGRAVLVWIGWVSGVSRGFEA
jgi:hypothetical protein